MQTSTSRRDARPYLIVIAAVVIVLDRMSKIWITNHIDRGSTRPVLGSFFGLSHVFNTGAAFSLFAESLSPALVRNALITFSIIAALVICAMMWRMGRRFSPTAVALGLILGGDLGNLYDRIHFHYVIDFLLVKFGSYHYPDFNVADSAIVIGACLLLLEIFRAQPEAAS